MCLKTGSAVITKLEYTHRAYIGPDECSGIQNTRVYSFTLGRLREALSRGVMK
jgi:hypothetical protein